MDRLQANPIQIKAYNINTKKRISVYDDVVFKTSVYITLLFDKFCSCVERMIYAEIEISISILIQTQGD